jgi:membrane protease YdiL (CAAX protease family)
MHFADHLFFFLLAVAYPAVSYINFQRLIRRVAAGHKVDRTKLYLETLAGHWTLFALAIALWIWQERTWSTLGFGLSTDLPFMIGVVLTIAGIGVLLWQVRGVASNDIGELRELRQQMGHVAIIIPRNGKELGRFYGLAATAGIVEEVLYRGFMIWYLGQFLPLWAAVLVSSAVFGIGHAYQGIASVPKITIVGAVFAGLYVLSGSLWLAMVLHTAVDVLQGRFVYDALRRCDDEDARAANNGDAVAASAS